MSTERRKRRRRRLRECVLGYHWRQSGLKGNTASRAEREGRKENITSMLLSGIIIVKGGDANLHNLGGSGKEGFCMYTNIRPSGVTFSGFSMPTTSKQYNIQSPGGNYFSRGGKCLSPKEII